MIEENGTVSLKEHLNMKIDLSNMAADQRFNAQQLALKDALTSQEKAVAAALESTKEAIGKAEIATDKRFDLLSEKIDGVHDTITKNVGAQGVYVTHTDLTAALDKLQTSILATLNPVVSFMNAQTGKEKGTDTNWTRVAIIIGGAGTVITLMFKLIP